MKNPICFVQAEAQTSRKLDCQSKIARPALDSWLRYFQSPQTGGFQQQSQVGMQSTGMAQAIQLAQSANPSTGNSPQPSNPVNGGLNPGQKPVSLVSPSGSQSMPEEHFQLISSLKHRRPLLPLQ